MTTMDLWYDLAIRERPDLDEDVIDPGELQDTEARPPEAEAARAVAVDFF
jgi:hypothetical protein